MNADEALLEIVSEKATRDGVVMYRVALRWDGGSDTWHSPWFADQNDQKDLVDTLLDIAKNMATRTLSVDRHDA